MKKTNSPIILNRNCISLSPFVNLIQKEVRISESESTEIYHGLSSNDYVCMIASTGRGRRKIPLVRQFRPIIESFTWELPAGTIDHGETPIECAIRELYEETGFYSKSKPIPLGTFAADTGRLEIMVHGFYFEHVVAAAKWQPEPNVETKTFSREELRKIILDGQFINAIHVGYLYLSGLKTNVSI